MIEEIHGHRFAREVAECARIGDENLTAESVCSLWKSDRATILRRYLRTVKRHRSAALRAGFFAALSEFIASAVEGEVTDPDFYRKAAHATA